MKESPESGVWRLEVGEALPDWVARLDRTAFGTAWKAPAAHEALWLIPEVAFARWACIPAAGEAELLRIAVDPAHRGGGLGQRLLTACQEALAAAGMGELHLEVRASNQPAIRLYRACGWERCGLRGGYYPDGEDAALFRFVHS
ncbi:MAG: GNAT family N-acetyltransferase [Holophagaceae bacterium]|nr:GNAT family N-acetyltransferase [Holophagaceae bacterium]